MSKLLGFDFILFGMVAFLLHTHALPLPRNVSSANALIAPIHVHGHGNVHHEAIFPVSVSDRHRRDIDFDRDTTGGSDLDGLEKEELGDVFEIEVDPTQPPVDDELLRFNNALEQALDYLSEMDSNIIDFNLDNAHPITAAEL
ncbi:hypothetical protein Clacol_010526 [Clathrus columnatus]|uniref:Uncharacterized protein n=1 Tax=Clathrus columnatus TaxID=1419009 RepID=A0AAV5AP07_9AGAM|nr:hypothetical protein Clacol_010526 [Clathrus columnatus]